MHYINKHLNKLSDSLDIILFDDRSLISTDLLNLLNIDVEQNLFKKSAIECSLGLKYNSRNSLINQRLNVRVLENIKDAFKLIKLQNPDIIIFDAHTHHFNSLKLIERWREYASVVVTSDFYSKDIEQKVIKTGALAYLSRPHNPDDLEDIFINLINQVLTKTSMYHNIH
jgi:CheY-like chemotaxis protein